MNTPRPLMAPATGAGRGFLLDGVSEHRLDNGLRVLLKRVPTVPIVSVWCFYSVGSANERPGLTGVAHWVEHMNFKGTEGIPMAEMKALIEEQGGYWNGYTWLDLTTYFSTLSKDALGVALRLEAERMHRCLYDVEDVASERTVILSELQGGENDPTELLDIEVTAAAFRAHPYHWPTIGYRSDLEAITRDDLWGFYRTYYAPNNATLVIAGDLDEESTLEEVRRHFGAIPRGVEPPRVRTVEPEQRGERRVTLEQPGNAAYVRAAYHAPTPADDDFYPLLVLDAVLGGAKGMNLWSGMGGGVRRSSYLYRRLVESRIAASVSTSLAPTRDPFLFALLVTVRDGVTPEEAEAALVAALDEFPATDLPERELAKALNQVRARFVFECASVTDMAHQLGYFATIADHRLPAAFEEKLARVTPDAVREAARTILAASNRTIGVFRPLRRVGEGSVAASASGESQGSGARAFSGRMRSGQGKEPAGGRRGSGGFAGPFGRRPGSPSHDRPGQVAGLDPRRDVLPNGLVVITQEHHDVPTVTVSLEFRAGARLDPAGLEGAAHMAAGLLREGTARFSGEEIAEAFDFVGADLSAGAGRFTTAIGARMMAKDLATLLPHVASMAREPVFPESQVEVRRGEMLTAVAEFEEDTRAMAQEGLRKALYGAAHAMARRTLGTRSSIADILREHVRAFHERHFGPERATLVMVGDFVMDDALRMAGDLFGMWRQAPGTPPDLPGVPSFDGTRRDVVPIAGKSQVDLALGFPGIARSHPDYHALDLVNHVLGRFGMGGRLGARVREEHGLAYSVYSAFDAGLVPGPFVVRAGVDPAHVGAATEDILAVLRQMRDSGPTEDEIARSRRALIRSLPLRLETQGGIAAYLQTAELHGLGLDYVNRYAAIVEAIPMGELKRVASERLTPDVHALVLAGPTDRIAET